MGFVFGLHEDMQHIECGGVLGREYDHFFKHLFYPFLPFFITSFIIIYHIILFYNDLCSYVKILFLLLYF